MLFEWKFFLQNFLMKRVAVKVFIENWVSRLLLIQSKFYQCLKTKTSLKVLQVHFFIVSCSLKEMSCNNEDNESHSLREHNYHNTLHTIRQLWSEIKQFQTKQQINIETQLQIQIDWWYWWQLNLWSSFDGWTNSRPRSRWKEDAIRIPTGSCHNRNNQKS